MIYLDNAATTLHKPQSVVDAVVSALTTMGKYSFCCRCFSDGRCVWARYAEEEVQIAASAIKQLEEELRKKEN